MCERLFIFTLFSSWVHSWTLRCYSILFPFHLPNLLRLFGSFSTSFDAMKYVRVYSFCCSVRPFVFPSQGQSFCVKVYKTSYFEDPLMEFIHIWHDGRYRSNIFISTIPTPGVTLGSMYFHKKVNFLCLSLYSYIIKTLEEFHLYLT